MCNDRMASDLLGLLGKTDETSGMALLSLEGCYESAGHVSAKLERQVPRLCVKNELHISDPVEPRYVSSNLWCQRCAY